MEDAPITNKLKPAKIAYGIFCVSIVLPIVVFGAVIYAYIMRGNDPSVDSHLQHLIRTFWVGLMGTILGTVLAGILIGFVVLFFIIVWIVARIITGMLLAFDGRAVRGTQYAGMIAI